MTPGDTERPVAKSADDAAVSHAEGLLSTPAAQELALRQLREHLDAWVQHESGARHGTDPEELHQLRVAARRIEATLGVFKHQLPPRLVHARKSAKGVLRALGHARDLDVQLAELRQYAARLPEEERAAAAPLKTRLEHDRTRARARMVAMLDSEATRHWLETLKVASADLAGATAAEAPRAATVLPERIRVRYRKLKKVVRRLDRRASMDDYHAVRRRAKQLRYAIECGATLLGKPADDMLRSLRRLQDQLGAQQDAHVAKSRLAALVAETEPLPPETLFLMGRLAEHHLDTTRQARRTLARAWRKVSGKRWKALRARMAEVSELAHLQSQLRASEPATAIAPELPALIEPHSVRH